MCVCVLAVIAAYLLPLLLEGKEAPASLKIWLSRQLQKTYVASLIPLSLGLAASLILASPPPSSSRSANSTLPPPP